MSATFELALPSDLDAGRVAREAIAAREPELPRPVRDDVSLLVTELVTNAVRHGGGATGGHVEIELVRRDGRIRVRVTDAGTEFESPPRPTDGTNGDGSGGLGLLLVDRIAESWGVCPAPAGTCVWFEVPLAATP